VATCQSIELNGISKTNEPITRITPDIVNTQAEYDTGNQS